MEKNDPKKRALEEQFMKEKIFSNLTDLNTGFDAVRISYFTEEEFDIVLQRIEHYKIDVYGIEPFLDNEFYDVACHEEYHVGANNPLWYRTAFDKFRKEQKGLQYAASYNIPNEVYEAFLQEKGLL